MEAAVIWLVVWAALALIGPGIVYFIGIGIGFLISELTNAPGWAFLGVVIGWLGGVAWFIFAAVQTVFQIISVVNLASG